MDQTQGGARHTSEPVRATQPSPAELCPLPRVSHASSVLTSITQSVSHYHTLFIDRNAESQR